MCLHTHIKGTCHPYVVKSSRYLYHLYREHTCHQNTYEHQPRHDGQNETGENTIGHFIIKWRARRTRQPRLPKQQVPHSVSHLIVVRVGLCLGEGLDRVVFR